MFTSVLLAPGEHPVHHQLKHLLVSSALLKSNLLRVRAAATHPLHHLPDGGDLLRGRAWAHGDTGDDVEASNG